tara:strand:- start:2247 stop:3095 length:849 start_codon:yes stop_codon:yes gene_type:complete
MLKEHCYEWNEVVIGDNLNAITYGNLNDAKILSLYEPSIFLFDTFHASYDLGLTQINKGDFKYDIIRKFTFAAALAGRLPFANNLASIEVKAEEKLIKVVTKSSSVLHIRYDKLRVFEPEGVRGLPSEISEEVHSYRVLDWFDVRAGMKHQYDFLEDPENLFVRKIFFYLSERIDGAHKFKDLVAESILLKEQLHDPNYSDSLSRLKIISMMKNAGIKGRINGNNTFVPVKLDLCRREVIPNKSFDFVDEGDIIIDNRSEEQVINERRISSSRDSASSGPVS